MKKLISIIIAFTGAFVFAQDSTNYAMYHNTRKSGLIKINRMQDGWNTIRYIFNDRGRGPELLFKLKTNRKGGFEHFEMKGLNYMKDSTQVLAFGSSNSFRRVQGKDTINANFKGLNLFNYGTYGLYEFFFPVITDTSLHGDQPYQFKKITERSFYLKGRQITAQLWSYGLKTSKTPALVWMHPNHRMLAQFDLWTYIIEEGKEQLAPMLKKIADSVNYAAIENVSKELFAKSIDQSALFNCNIVDIEKGVLLKNQTILISNGKIEKIGDTASVNIPAGYTRINAGNKTVMPGMWDMHAHQFPGEGPRNLANGVTSVRDLGNSTDVEIQKKKTEQGKMLGPRIAWMCGFIDYNDDMAGPCGVLINSIEEGKAAVRKYHAAGYKSIKLYSSIKPSYIKPLADEAHKLGMRVHGHVPAFVTAEEAIQYGYDEVNHLNMMILGYFGNTIDTRTRIRLTIMKERAAEVSPNGTYGQKLIQLMKDKKTVLDPTSALWTQYTPKINMTKKDSIEKACIDTLHAWLAALHKNGIRLMPGTDAGGSNGYTSELKNYAKAGASNAEVLRMATIYPAEYCGWDKQLGTVTSGKIADLIILGGNPLENLNTLDNVQMVISNGKLFYTKDLRSATSAAGGNETLHVH